jgi:hypothetical protein
MSGTVTVQAPATSPDATTPARHRRPPPPMAMSVTLRVNDARPRRGRRVRFFGSYDVAQRPDGAAPAARQRGRYRTIARTRLRDAGNARSTDSRRLRIFRDGVYRQRVTADGDHLTGTSHRRRVDVR